MPGKLKCVGILVLAVQGLFVLGAWPADASILIEFPDAAPATRTATVSETPNPELGEFAVYGLDFEDLFGGAFPGETSPNELPTGTFVENKLMFVLGLASFDPIDADQTLKFTITGDYWMVQSTLDYAAASSPIFDSDVVTLSGNATHLVAPHTGESAPGPTIPFDIELHAGRSILVTESGVPVPNSTLQQIQKDIKIPVGGRYSLDFNSAMHGSDHDDFVFGQLAGKVANPSVPFVASHLEFWAGGVSGIHPVPEPATIISFGVGLVLLNRIRRTH